MLAINVSIPNLTVARREQFRSPQLQIQKERPTDVGVDWKQSILYTKSPCRYFPSEPFTANVVPKLIAMATSLSCRVSTISAFCRLATRTNHLVVICHKKPFIATIVPKLVSVATSLRSSISTMSSLDSFTPKTYRWNQTASRCHTAEVIIYLPHPIPKGNNRSLIYVVEIWDFEIWDLRCGWWDPIMIGTDVLI